MIKKIAVFHLMFYFIFCTKYENSGNLLKLKDWLALSSSQRPKLENLNFAKKALTREESIEATNLLIADKQKTMLEKYEKQWDSRLLKYGKFKMPFYYQIFGNKSNNGKSLFISLHGGGEATASFNDQQYINQRHLYDETLKNNFECVYLAPRAPTNTWDLWQQKQIDSFLNIIIQMAIIKEGVNPNKVYILGYSAGGDGVYQLAPRMADRWAAASMMAGHPGDAAYLSLRNIPFYIQVGALDNGYNRNGLAKKWKEILDNLHKNDTEGYIHKVAVREGYGHWMHLEDAVALIWMKKFQRNPIPKKVVWIQDNEHHTCFYWVKTPENKIKTGGKIIAQYNTEKNEISIINNYTNEIELLINDKMLNLDKPIIVKYKNKVLYQGLLHRSILNIYKTIHNKGDHNLAFPCVISIIDNQVKKKDFINP